MRESRWILWLLSLGVLVLVIFTPNLGFRLRNFIESDSSFSVSDLKVVEAENLLLKAELEKLKIFKEQLGSRSQDRYLPVSVYSRYPFNLKNEILVDAGFLDGVRKDQAVVLNLSQYDNSSMTGILIGKVFKVFEHRATVLTIFDERWNSPVGIGSSGVQSLLKGGNMPILTLIDKKAELKAGDLVYNLDANFPSLMPFGKVKEFRPSKDELLQEADLDPVYNINSIRSVLILKDDTKP